uniref:Uncharacterized protein n=1 Tax=Ananas comosus var. bracteatus TaxID=296719 RepID=A0A6V7P734_ANACO|nr:unnamed protein product [Ananas comosus var. bracteatus]
MNFEPFILFKLGSFNFESSSSESNIDPNTSRTRAGSLVCQPWEGVEEASEVAVEALVAGDELVGEGEPGHEATLLEPEDGSAGAGEEALDAGEGDEALGERAGGFGGAGVGEEQAASAAQDRRGSGGFGSAGSVRIGRLWQRRGWRGVDQLGVAARDEQVAGEGDLEPGGDGESGDGADDGLAAHAHGGDGVGGGVLDVALEDILGGGEVDAGAEGAAAPGVGVEAAERACERDHHGARERVERARAVDGDHGHRGSMGSPLHLSISSSTLSEASFPVAL